MPILVFANFNKSFWSIFNIFDGMNNVTGILNLVIKDKISVKIRETVIKSCAISFPTSILFFL